MSVWCIDETIISKAEGYTPLNNCKRTLQVVKFLRGDSCNLKDAIAMSETADLGDDLIGAVESIGEMLESVISWMDMNN